MMSWFRRIQKFRASRTFICPEGGCRKTIIAGFLNFPSKYTFYDCNGQNGFKSFNKFWLWATVLVPAAALHEIHENAIFCESFSKQFISENSSIDGSGIYKIEDGSVVSNIHTAKWRVFTDKGRDLYVQGKLEEAEKYFLSALEEAKEGFGMRDPHVAAACNNLAELYRLNKEFDKAGPLYTTAINILEECFGHEDIRVGSALYNMGQFYFVQRKVKEAYTFYERALKIQGAILGHSSPYYANTLFHLGVAASNLAHFKDAVIFIQDSIRIVEESNGADLDTCIKRLHFLAQVHLKSRQPTDALAVQQKVMYLLESSKGWKSMWTVFAAECVAMTLQSLGRMTETIDLLERCLDARKDMLPLDNIQIALNKACLAHATVLRLESSKDFNQFGQLKCYLCDSVRVALEVCNKCYYNKKGGNEDSKIALLALEKALRVLELIQKINSKPHPERVAVKVDHLCHCSSYFTKLAAESSGVAKIDHSLCLKQLVELVEEITLVGGLNDPSLVISIQNLRDIIKVVQDRQSPHSCSPH